MASSVKTHVQLNQQIEELSEEASNSQKSEIQMTDNHKSTDITIMTSVQRDVQWHSDAITDKPKQYKIESPLIGKFIQLKNIKNGETITYEIETITLPTKDEDTNQYKLPDLVQKSTNYWLFTNSYTRKTKEEKESKENSKTLTNFSIAMMVIIIQIVSYFTMAYYLMLTYDQEIEGRAQNCYGPNCKTKEQKCMHISTGGVVGILLIGFLWADIINVFSMMRNKHKLIGSILVFAELVTAMVCGILVGLYSVSEFDAINGAVGILFVHDLDEKIFSAMILMNDNKKKIFALLLWIILSVIIAILCACNYTNGFYFAGSGNICREGEFKCGNGECIWYGFVCNGMQECTHGSDEQLNCNYALINCPIGTFMCNSTGECIDENKRCNGIFDCDDGSDELFVASLFENKFECISDGLCIDNSKRCNGILDCDDGSDEGRDQHCSQLINNITCSVASVTFEQKYLNNSWYEKVSEGGMFKCSNGQCIDAKYMCDGIKGDCIDGSDEYPFFNKIDDWPYLKECPYSKLIQCDINEVLCKVSGQCISKMRICDGNMDCPNGEDERTCNIIQTQHFEGICYGDYGFQCGGAIAFMNETTMVLFKNETVITFPKNTIMSTLINTFYEKGTGKCIPNEWRCDGIKDCGDGSDEELCKYFECSDNEFQCDDGKCISKNWLCDGMEDCKPEQYRCNSKNKFDCIHGEDEDWKMCNGTYSTVLDAVTCNDPMITRTLTQDEWGLTFKVIVPCNYNYSTLQVTTCTNATLTVNTFLTITQQVLTIHTVVNGTHNEQNTFINDDASDTIWQCDINSLASTVTIQDGGILPCTTPGTYYKVTVEGKYQRESIGDYGIVARCF